MINTNFRGYGGDASQTDNFDWYTPVEQEPLDYLGYPPSGGGGGYSDPVRGDLYIPEFQYGGDSLGGLNDALSQQIAEEIRRSLEAQIQAQIEADRKLQEAAEYFAIAENRRKLAEAIEAERLRILADENERQRLSDVDNERIRIAAAELAADAERQRLAELAASSEKQRLAAEAAKEAEKARKEAAEAEIKRKEVASAEAIASAAVAAAEAETKRLAAIEAQKKADDEKKKSDVIVTPSVVTPIRTVLPEKATMPVTMPSTQAPTKSNNTLVIGGILLAVVVLYVITKDKN